MGQACSMEPLFINGCSGVLSSAKNANDVILFWVWTG